MATAATIVDRHNNAEAVPDYALAITNMDISRKSNVGTDWRWIRIGLRYSISSSSAQTTTILRPQFAIGMCSGTASTYSTPISHFVGVDLDQAGNDSYINHAGTSTNYYITSQDTANVGLTRRMAVKVNTARSVFGGSQEDFCGAYIISGSPVRTVTYLDIIKQTTGSNDTIVEPGLWTLRYYETNAQTTDTAASLFYRCLYSETASAGANVCVSAPIQQQVPVSQSINGYLDTVNIYWSENVIPLELSDVVVWKFK